jgi:hypothetical protein
MSIESALQEVADRYRRNGYRVTLKPRGDALPPFAAGYDVDMIATDGKHHILTQVKTDLSDLSRDKSLPQLAEVTKSQPGWRFDLVILEQESPLEEAAAASGEPSVKQISELLVHAERSAEARDTLAAYLVAWAGLEAAMRYRSRLAKIAPAKPASAVVLIRNLFSHGLLNSKEMRRLDSAYKMRSRAAHGFPGTRIRRTDVDYVTSLARRLLEENGKSEQEAS